MTSTAMKVDAPRPRRRGRKATKGRNEKENQPSAKNTSHKTLQTKSGTVSKESMEIVLDVPWPSNTSQHYLQDAMKIFQNAQTSTPSAKFWDENSGLAEAVVRVSISKRGESFGTFHLQEQAGALINHCRSLLRETAGTRKEEIATTCNNLLLAAHGLRAAKETAHGNIPRQEAIMKLLFHLITVSSDCFIKDTDVMIAGVICMAGYDTLGRLLNKYQCLRDKKSAIGFRWEQNGDDGLNKNLFCVPFNLKDSKEVGSMTLRQVATIALKATFSTAAVARKLNRAGSIKTMRHSSTKAFGPGIFSLIEHSCDSKAPPYHFMITLIQQVAIPWISFLFASKNAEFSKDAIAQCKVAYRMLWESAAEIAEVKHTCVDNSIPDSALEIRLRSISVLMPSEYASKDETLLLNNKHFGTVCTSAWKAAAMYVQQGRIATLPIERESPLFKFHESLGSRIHAIVPTCDIPWSYVEYCVYQALQTGRCPSQYSLEQNSSLVENFRRELKSHDGIVHGHLKDGVCLTLLLLACSVRSRIEHHSPFTNYTTESNSSTMNLSSQADDIINIFRQVWNNANEHLAQDDRVKTLKLFAKISLNRTLFKVLSDQAIKREIQQDVEIAASILCTCIGPLCSISCQKENPETHQFFDLMVECYIRSASCYGKLAAEEASVNLNQMSINLEQSNDAIAALRNSLLETSSKKLRPLWEKAAKGLAIIARQRANCLPPVELIPPLLLSLQFFLKLTVTNSNYSEYHMSSRWAHLSTVFESVNMTAEAQLAQAGAAFCRCSERQIENSSKPNSANIGSLTCIIHLLASQSKHLFTTQSDSVVYNEKDNVITRKLVTLYAKNVLSDQHFEIPENKPLLCPSSIAQLLVSSTLSEQSLSKKLQEKFGSRLQFCEVLRAIFGSNECDTQITKRPSSSLSGEKLSSLIHIVVCLGSTIRKTAQDSTGNWEDSKTSAVTEDYMKITAIVADLIRCLTASYPEVVAPPLRAMVYLFASTALLAYKNIHKEFINVQKDYKDTENNLCRVAKTLADKAQESFDTLMPLCDNFGLKSFYIAMKAATAYFCLCLSRLHDRSQLQRKYEECFAVCSQAYDILASDIQSTVDLYEFSRQSMVWTLSGFYNMLQIEGDIVGSVVISRWMRSLTRHKNSGERDWYCSVALNANMTSDIWSRAELSSASILVSKSTNANVTARLASMEFEACKIRQWVRAPTNTPDDNAVDASGRLSELGEMIPESNDPIDGVLAFWVQSTISMGISELEESRGNLLLAMKHVRKCIEYCRKISTLLRNQDIFHSDQEVPFWVLSALSSLLLEEKQRRVDCIFRSAMIYIRIGNHRKADGYVLSVQESFAPREDLEEKSSLFSLLVAGNAATTSRAKAGLRQYQAMRANAKSFDWVLEEISRWRQYHVSGSNAEPVFESKIHLALADTRSLISIGDILYSDTASGDSNEFSHFYEEAELKFAELTMNPSIPWLSSDPSLLHPLLQGEHLETMLIDLKLRQSRSLTEAPAVMTADDQHRVYSLCKNVLNSNAATTTNRAWAFFHLGTIELDISRQTGELVNLWQQSSDSTTFGCRKDIDGFEHINKAREYFLASISYLGSATEVFYRAALRNLALVTGPDHSSKISGMSSCALILSSIGRMTRQHMMTLIPDTSSTEVLEMFGTFDRIFDDPNKRNRQVEAFCQRFAQMVPFDWIFVVPAICSSGEILMTSISRSNSDLVADTICIFAPKDAGGAYDEIVKPLDEIIQKSQDHLQGTNASAECKEFNEEAAKRSWWNERKKLDADLQNLIELVETSYFGSRSSRRLFRENEGDDSSSDDDDSTSGLACKNLSLQFESASCQAEPKHKIRPSDERQKQEERQELSKMTVIQLKSRLRKFSVPDAKMRKLRKHDLIDMVIKEQHHSDTFSTGNQNESPSPGSRRQTCTFLILDENLHRFPFESMSFLKGKTVCRVPSLPFVFLTLHNRVRQGNYEPPMVNPNNVSYILDPENNLHATRNRLVPVIEALSLQNGCDWKGVIGCKPSSAYVEKNLRTEGGMFLYFGHGGGQTFFSRRQIEGMINGDYQNDYTESCHAAVVLMGCSSGKLLSINRKGTSSTDELPLFFDPEGIAISYLCAGAPCVVGNLWDVTDHDIDRYAASVLSSFLGRSGTLSGDSLALCISSQRQACKLRYLNGCAPVYYGVPVYLSPQIPES